MLDEYDFNGGDDRRRCDQCNGWHDEPERQRCDCGDIFCSEDCLADHKAQYHAPEEQA